jgi:hypothetical protein
MLRRVLPLLLAGALLLPGRAPAAGPAQAAGELPTLPPLATATPLPQPAPIVRTTIDTLVVDHLAKLQAFEAAYQLNHRGYFQSLASHSVVPADGAALAPDKLASGPTDQAETLTAFWSDAQLVAEIPYSFRTDVYDGPDGQGYVLSVQVQLGGELWERSVNVGPETYRETPWHVVVVEK